MLKLLFAFTIFIVTTAKANMKEIDQFFKDELKRVEVHESKNGPEFFASHISQAKSKTPYVFILLHGLYESPNHLLPLHKELYEKYQQNTVTLRLPGHFDKKIKMEELKYTDWLEELPKTVKPLLALGEKVVFIGHSTGGLLQTYIACQHPDKTAAVIALAGAFEISWWGRMGIRLGSFINHDLWDEKTQRRKIAKLGYEVEALSLHLEKEYKANPQAVENIKMLFIDSKADSLIPAGSGVRFFSGFKKPENRRLKVISKTKDIDHRDIVSAAETFRIIHEYLPL